LAEPKTTHLKNYTPPTYLIPEVDLVFHLGETETIVENTILFKKNANGSGESCLFLDGDGLELTLLELNGAKISDDSYEVQEKGLLLKDLPDEGQIKVVTKIDPQSNKAFSGLYKTKTMFCTQMEAEGFRRMTYFQDRPDVLSKYTTTMYADKKLYPILLSNGEWQDGKDLDDGRHMAKWKDPFLKPCYLFALVAGDLDFIKDTFVTASNKKVDLAIYVDKGKQDRARHAMLSLKQSMTWDEETYGLEYDLNVYNIVAVDDFNMGAMENKGLNIFNSKYVLANLETATDDEFTGILRVIGHEYFHNWSGNRVTCRDWFQLSLKEGLTVYRDQEFTCDLTSREVKRIEDVDLLRTRQFPEDAGPMAHPVRPESYISIDNFYTVTVYMKGAEVIRMLQNLIGLDMFKKGLALYFELYDGQAVTTDDFVAAMEKVSGRDLKQFKRWYHQAGTPEVHLKTSYDAEKQSLSLSWKQECKNPISGQPQQPFVIPIRFGAMGSNGSSMAFSLSPDSESMDEYLFELSDAEQTLTLYNLAEAPTLSLLRDFTAPVKLNYEQTDESLYLLMTHDCDAVNRWDAGQQIYLKTILSAYESCLKSETSNLPAALEGALLDILKSAEKKPALAAQLLRPPSYHYVSQFIEQVDPQALSAAMKFLKKEVAQKLERPMTELYQNLAAKNLGNSQTDIGIRSLKNTLLQSLGSLENDASFQLASDQFHTAENMTDKLAALMVLGHGTSELGKTALSSFYEDWKHDSLVINKWLSVNALSRKPGAFEQLKDIESNSVYDNTNPNNVYSLLNAFASENWQNFHEPSGDAYMWYAGKVLDIDSRNPQVASRLASAFNIKSKLAPNYQEAMTKALEKIHQAAASKNLYEIVDRALKQ